MSEKYKVYGDHIPHFVTITVVGWIDALSRPQYKDLFLESLRYCAKNKGLRIHAWVIMNNHVHLIISAGGNNDIPSIMRDLKKFTSKKLIEAVKTDPRESRKEWIINMMEYIGATNQSNDIYQFWQKGYHPIVLDSYDKAMQRLNYLHENPVRAGIVWEAAQYKYSSAIDYLGDRRGLIEVCSLF